MPKQLAYHVCGRKKGSNVMNVASSGNPDDIENLWKEAFPVGLEWENFEKVYGMEWDFSHLEEAFEEGGQLHGRIVYMFGGTEPQQVEWKDRKEVVPVPTVCTVLLDFPPSELLGIKSVQMESESIIPMRQMKMVWVPFIPQDVAEYQTLDRYRAQVFVIKCTQRRAALKNEKVERRKTFEYCLPYILNPHKPSDDDDASSAVPILFPLDHHGGRPPLLMEFDWEMDTLSDAVEQAVKEGLPVEEEEKLKEKIKEAVKEKKGERRKEKERKQKLIDDMSPAMKEGFAAMKVIKWYPKAKEGLPDVLEFESAYINRYYGKADEVIPPLNKPRQDLDLWGNPRAPVVPTENGNETDNAENGS